MEKKKAKQQRRAEMDKSTRKRESDFPGVRNTRQSTSYANLRFICSILDPSALRSHSSWQMGSAAWKAISLPAVAAASQPKRVGLSQCSPAPVWEKQLQACTLLSLWGNIFGDLGRVDSKLWCYTVLICFPVHPSQKWMHCLPIKWKLGGAQESHVALKSVLGPIEDNIRILTIERTRAQGAATNVTQDHRNPSGFTPPPSRRTPSSPTTCPLHPTRLLS